MTQCSQDHEVILLQRYTAATSRQCRIVLIPDCRPNLTVVYNVYTLQTRLLLIGWRYTAQIGTYETATILSLQDGDGDYHERTKKTESSYHHHVPRAGCGRYLNKFPTALTALYRVLSLSPQSFIDVWSSLDNSRVEKSSMNSTFESTLPIVDNSRQPCRWLHRYPSSKEITKYEYFYGANCKQSQCAVVD